MPLLPGHPTSGFRSEAEDSGAPRWACINAVACAQVGVERGVAYLAGLDRKNRSRANRVNSEAAQRLAEVAPSVEIPVRSIVDQSLGRHDSPRLLVIRPAVINELQAF